MSSFSIEVFPPKDSSNIDKVLDNLKHFAQFKPEFISVTYRKGGEEFTGKVAGYIQNELHINGIAHLTCAGMDKAAALRELTYLKQNGISRVLALRGDLSEDRPTMDFRYATDMMRFINEVGGFDLYGACYPEGHPESDNFDEDIEVMKKKADLGVKAFISQLFYDNEDFYRMLDKLHKVGVTVPVEAGIMPLTNVKQIFRTVTLSGCKLPSKLTRLASRFENNPEAMYQAGVNYAVEQITDLLISGVKGIHLYSMNNPKLAADILEEIRPIMDGVAND